jgi:adenosylcobyric acid synthase
MLGRTVRDPAGVEGAAVEVDGLGLLDVETIFSATKVLGLPDTTELGARAAGYEIHHGRIHRGPGAEPCLGGARSGSVFGTMWHGALEGDEFRAALLRETLGLAPSGVSFPAARERRLDLLGDLVEHHVDVDALVDLIFAGAPAALPFLSPGAP